LKPRDIFNRKKPEMLKFKYCRRLLLDIINPQKVETPEVQMTGRSLHENKGTIGDHHSKDPVQLEQGAYRMLDESVAAILKDSDFKKAFLK
jgi:hypothetical protein